MSMSAALAYRWDGEQSRLVFQTTPDSYDAPKLIRFVQHLKRELRGAKCILVWDGLPAHKSTRMKKFLAKQTAWLSIVSLPGYAPDLNPVEALWSNIKGQELANLCAADLTETGYALRRGIRRVRRRTDLPHAFLNHAGLFF